MHQSMKTFLIIGSIVLLWAGSSGLLGLVFRIVQPCMSLGVVVCTLLLLAVSRNENSWRRLTWQPYEDDDSNIILFGILFGVPVAILFAALLEWLLMLILIQFGIELLAIAS